MAGGRGPEWESMCASLRRTNAGKDTQACARDGCEHVLV